MLGIVLDAGERMMNTVNMVPTLIKRTIYWGRGNITNVMTVQKCKVLCVPDLGGGQERLPLKGDF